MTMSRPVNKTPKSPSTTQDGSQSSMPARHKLQGFTMMTVKRTDLQKAPYNPRTINDRNMKALKKSLEKNNLLQPIVWNKRTGNVVSGHQRLEALDSSARTDKYSLDVAVVDLDEKAEVAANMAAPAANGSTNLLINIGFTPRICCRIFVPARCGIPVQEFLVATLKS